MLLLATFFIALPSCSSDDEPGTGIEQAIIGTWDATHVKSQGSWVDITDYPNLAISATFNSNGTYYGRGALGTGSGTYKVSGKTVKTYVGGDLYATYYVKTLSGKYAEATITMGNSSLELKLAKR